LIEQKVISSEKSLSREFYTESSISNSLRQTNDLYRAKTKCPLC
jgi:hypothetical protein